MERKIIFKCCTGSHLYGTNHPESDEDYQGVFLPSATDLLSLHKCPEEWTENVKVTEGLRNGEGDVDCKYFSLQKFLRLAAQGQPGQLEMLFAPDNMILVSTPEWQEIIKNRNLFLSKKGIAPFIGFALSQAHRAVIKGDNLRKLRSIIEWGETLSNVQKNYKLSDFFALHADTPETAISLRDTKIDLKYYTNDQGFPQVSVAGRDWDQNVRTKSFLTAIEKLEDRYGTRSQAAAESEYDYKSLGHAVRLLGQAEEFLTDGKITLPRPDAEYLKTVLRGTIDDTEIDWFDLLNEKIDILRLNLQPRSSLPDEPVMSAIEELCIKILREHI